MTYAVKNMVANLTGMICDGAKPSCAMKLTSGVSTAVFSAMLAMEHKCVTAVEGIIENDVDRTIHNLTRIGAQGMNETDLSRARYYDCTNVRNSGVSYRIIERGLLFSRTRFVLSFSLLEYTVEL